MNKMRGKFSGLRRSIGKWPVYVGAAIAVLLAALALWPRSGIFTLDVVTEVVTITLTDSVLSEWVLGETQVIDDPFAEISTGHKLRDGATLVVETGTQVRMKRHGDESLRVQLTNDSNGTVGKILRVDGEQLLLGSWALLLVSSHGRPLVFPFRGKLTAGDDVAGGVDSILLGGAVSVVEKQLIGGARYVAGTETLDTGDRVGVWHRVLLGLGEPVPATVTGFVRVQPRDGFSGAIDALTLVAHGQADFVQVDRLGSGGYQVRSPQLIRFLHDPLLAAAAVFVTLLAAMLEILSKCVPRTEDDNAQASASPDTSKPEST